MTCRELIDFLAAYLDGELPADERARFDAHLGECPECVAYLTTYRDTIALAKGACATDPTPDVPERLVRAIAAARKT
jgi:anti-sigma factor (TIGR02949 family)